MKIILMISGLLAGVSSFAQTTLPGGMFTGSISSFNQFCRLDHADIEFVDAGNGVYNVNWTESGWSQYSPSSDCGRYLDATFRPTNTPNVWSVDFINQNSFFVGQATLKGNVLEVTATLNSMDTGFIDFDTRLIFGADQKSIQYSCRLESVGGPDDFATGNLYQ